MERRIEENYVTHALGFKIIINRVEMRKFRGEWVPQINWTALQQLALWALAHKPTPLTGNEVRFVRTYMNKTLKEFAVLCGVSSHATIMNWESKGEDFTGMHRPTEIVLRAHILDVVPASIWERFESKRKAPKAAVSKVLADVSSFEAKPAEPLSFIAGDDHGDPFLEFAYV